jgi:light-regulated signal transduction histidine kinase (bacteriophytochrome)
MRSDQLLRGMHKVVSHDLPNQMVVLQSLLHFLNEESAQLSDDGREYVRRLVNATRRANDMVRFLKEMARLKKFACQSETITLATFGRELQGELQRLHPEHSFEFDWHWDVPAIVGDPRVYLHAVLELCAGLLSPHAKTCRLSANSARRGPAIKLTFHLEEMSGASPIPYDPEIVEQRMELILARQWLALGGAGVEILRPDDAAAAFVIIVPN